MARVNIFNEFRELVGWFDSKKAERFEEATEWDGSNHISIATGSQWDHEALYRTVGGRWVLHRWSQWQGRPETYRFLTDQEAQTWLLANDEDEAVERFFGEIEEERGPGRPEIGPEIGVRLPQAMLDRIDGLVERGVTTRAEVVRRLIGIALRSSSPGMGMMDVVIIEAGADYPDQLDTFEIRVLDSGEETVAEAMTMVEDRGYRVMTNAEGGNCELVRLGDGENYIAITVYPDEEDEDDEG